jgi:signal transduction histidine kinase
MSIRFQLFIGFFILIFIFIVDFFVNERLSNEVIKNTNYVSNSETVIRNSNMLHKEMIEMQSGFRGFLLTGQTVFLQPYYNGLKSIPPKMKEQKQLVSRIQLQKLDSIEALHQKWVGYSNDLITSRIDTFPEASKRYKELFETKLKTEVGKKLNDRIQEVFLAFDNHEYQIRLARREALQTSLWNTRVITLSLTIVSILIGLLSSIYFVRIITRRISKMVNLAEDISKGVFKTVEDHKEDELNKLAISLNTMSQTLEKNFSELTKKNRELDQFGYVVSHDLKAPLRGIANIISWVEEDHEHDTTPEIRHKLSLIKGRTNRLESMINGLLEYARIGKIKKGMERVDIGVLLKETIELLVPDNYKVRIEGEMPSLITERLHIEQVFSNLISNAVKYNKGENSEIIIRSAELKNHYEFTVSDNGPGIDSKYFDKIFVIFQTLQERDAFESTGVGLAIVKKIIEDNKGTIRVESKLGKGTSFIFTWPKN